MPLKPHVMPTENTDIQKNGKDDHDVRQLAIWRLNGSVDKYCNLNCVDVPIGACWLAHKQLTKKHLHSENCPEQEKVSTTQFAKSFRGEIIHHPPLSGAWVKPGHT